MQLQSAAGWGDSFWRPVAGEKGSRDLWRGRGDRESNTQVRILGQKRRSGCGDGIQETGDGQRGKGITRRSKREEEGEKTFLSRIQVISPVATGANWQPKMKCSAEVQMQSRDPRSPKPVQLRSSLGVGHPGAAHHIFRLLTAGLATARASPASPGTPRSANCGPSPA